MPSDRSLPVSLLTVEEVAELLRLTPKGVYGLSERGVIPSIKVGGRLRFDPSVVVDWVRNARRVR